MSAICYVFGLANEEPAVVRHADTILLATEQRDLMPEGEAWYPEIPTLPDPIVPWSDVAAERRFIEMACELMGPRECL